MKEQLNTPEKRTLFKKLFGGKPKQQKASVEASDALDVEHTAHTESVGDIDVKQMDMPTSDDIIKRSEEAAEHLRASMVNGDSSTSTPSKNKSSDSANFAGGAAAVVAGVALLTPRPANAWVGDIVDGIVEKAGGAVLEPMKSLFGNLMEGFGLSNMFSTQEGAKAQGRSTDAINEVSHTAENAKVMRATEPPPHMCLNIQEKKHIFNTYEKQKSRTSRTQSTYFSDATGYGNGSHTSKIFDKIKANQAALNTEEDTVKAILKTSPIIAESEDTLSEENRENAILSIDAMVGPTADKIGKPNLKATGGFRQREAHKISLHNRLSVARNVLVKQVEEKAAPEAGEASSYESRKLMVERTYGAGSEWYQEVLSKGDAVPILKDQIVLSGTTNGLLFDLVESSKDTNRLLATQIISTIERA